MTAPGDISIGMCACAVLMASLLGTGGLARAQDHAQATAPSTRAEPGTMPSGDNVSTVRALDRDRFRSSCIGGIGDDWSAQQRQLATIYCKYTIKLRQHYNQLIVDFSMTGELPDPILRNLLDSIRIFAPSRFTHEGFSSYVFKGVRVRGNLALDVATVDLPIILEGPSFGGRVLISGTTFDAGLTIRGGRFADTVAIEDTLIRGHLRLEDNQFAAQLILDSSTIGGRLDLIGNDFSAPSKEPLVEPPDGTQPSRLRLSGLDVAQPLSIQDNLVRGRHRSAYLIDSHLPQGAEIRDNTFEQFVYVGNNHAGDLSIADNIFTQLAVFTGNQVDLFDSFQNRYASGLVVRGNRAALDFAINSDMIGEEELVLVNINYNKVGSEFSFAPRFMGSGIDHIDLSYNEVQGPLLIWLATGPDRDRLYRPNWQGRGGIDLTGTRIATKLEIALALFDPGQGRLVPLKSEWMIGRRALARAPGGFCRQPGSSSLNINLTTVDVHILGWYLPIRCSYRWDGAHLTYEYWGDPDLKYEDLALDENATLTRRHKKPIDEDHFRDMMLRWRYTMNIPNGLERAVNGAALPNAESLAFMAQYLQQRGYFNEAREITEEAKKYDYHPGDFRSCVAEQQGEGRLADSTAWLVCAKDQVIGMGTLIMLWPGGYGAKPGRALIMLGLLVIAGWLTYLVYARLEYRYRGPLWRALVRMQRDSDGRHPVVAASDGRLGTSLREGPALFRLTPDLGQDVARIAPLPRLGDGAWPATCSAVPGFMQYSNDDRPQYFSLFIFSVDSMLPVVNLHAYDKFYPLHPAVRLISFLQHIAGWWLLSVFLASATVL